ncbi:MULTISPECIES: NupC/NupG family nucleoside CNT transporter [Buttiauxella]|jgi:CNT family concentrative nucleoside transporter|uniref:Nucleoside permease n=1 Tax=Buttiauxella gaviniae ATCC 51604 TaxID=1354253 RepID=A0A1B7I2F2_9ENTR|nr:MULTISPECIES: NupC/NupG family nucleoside CNT transporter [Buttiauxella]MRT12125.1 NupC/NupG family nucleoside CNT transporter [Enterobacteriaceae bacterium RIT711]MCE0811936.1 NupC/NupG family nucleoside CNT transporter [Buttiauxella sp. S04-F03]MCE0845636.1 NupC/NupG family nucleoside CNT transporter [Buttiauxella sp. A2-C1_F]OAT22321.1 nucleoside permease [Buttiauxella gaviniae ATCC 51604]TDX17954.1 CNT family concentrative nucleoside transporter [Buttiauxella sp. BIGb0552]
MQLLMGLIGMIVLLLIAVLLSSNRKAINLRTVLGAWIIQVGIGALILYVPVGRQVLLAMSEGVANVIGYGNAGISFLFGGLVSDKMFEVFGGGGFIFALRVLPIIVFFSSLIAVLYYLGIMQFVIRILGGGLRKILKTSRTESLSATANIFVGQTEAPLVVRPYIATMTRSELFAVMCGGLASVAGSVLAGYAQMGVPLEYLIAASFMAAPGGLLFAKIILPETETPNDSPELDSLKNDPDRPANVLDAAASGAASGMQLALNVGAMLLAFVALIALLNGMLSGIGGWFNYPQLSMELILGWVFSPLAWVIGVPWSEANVAGSFIGQKLIINEFVAYLNFGEYLKDDATVAAAGLQVLSDHTKAIISFALCGFANLSSIAILIGGLGSMAPNRRHDIAQLGLKAVAAGTLSNLMSATIAGVFLSL